MLSNLLLNNSLVNFLNNMHFSKKSFLFKEPITTSFTSEKSFLGLNLLIRNCKSSFVSSKLFLLYNFSSLSFRLIF